MYAMGKQAGTINKINHQSNLSVIMTVELMRKIVTTKIKKNGGIHISEIHWANLIFFEVCI